MVCATCAQIAGQVATGAGLLAWCATAPSEAKAYVRSNATYVGNGVGFVSLIVGVCVYVALGVALLWVVGELFAFHVTLCWKRMSTYEYIVAERAIAADAREQAIERGGGRGRDHGADERVSIVSIARGVRAGTAGEIERGGGAAKGEQEEWGVLP